jgi:hypothetical protein
MNLTDTTPRRVISSAPNRFETDTTTPPAEDAVVVKAASVLLGIELRGWLATREQEFLDSLAPNNAISFLVLGDRYLHPREVELFPLDLVRAAIRQGGDAVFSHRCQSGTCDCPTACRVFTGMVGSALGQPLVLGMFGPDEPINKQLLEDRFESVISIFRAARRSTRTVHDALGDTPAGSARIIVNRASGRVIHIDRQLTDELDLPATEFVAREYGTIEGLLRRLFLRNRVHMENLACGCLNLTCMTFTPARSASHRDTDGSDFVDSLRGQLAGITSSAEYIESHLGDLPEDDVRDLVARIARAGEHLDRRLARHQLLANFEKLDNRPVNIIYDLEHAIDRISAIAGDGITVDIASEARVVEIPAPPDSCRLLFESVLETHRLAPGNIGATSVRVTRDDTDGCVITVKTVLPGTMKLADLEKVWHQDTQAVAAKLGITVRRKLILESNTIVTRICVPADKESHE